MFTLGREYIWLSWSSDPSPPGTPPSSEEWHLNDKQENKSEYILCLNESAELICMTWTLTFGVDLLQGHLVGWKGSDHLIGREQTDTILLFGSAGPNAASEEHVRPAVSALHHRQVNRPLEAVHLVRGLDKKRDQEENVTAYKSNTQSCIAELWVH